MFIHPMIDGPAIIKLGPVVLPFYGIAFSLSLFICDYLAQHRIHKLKHLTADNLENLWLYLFIGGILGARLGDIIFYRLHYCIDNPWSFQQSHVIKYNAWISLAITALSYAYTKWIIRRPLPVSIFIIPLLILFTGDAGMSFHGALVGGLLAILAYSYRFKQYFLETTDFIAPLIPPGLGIGRFANFINGELWGRPTHMPWGIIFPRADFEPRHPSQLYECFLEGILLFFIVWHFSKRPQPKGAIFGLSITLYAIVRILVEFFRQPDPAIGLVAWQWLTMGQLLSIPMLIGGSLILLKAYFVSLPTSR